MRTREADILASEDLGAAGTEIIPIRLVDPISRLLFKWSVTVGAGARLYHPTAAFSKIEIVDGSDVLLSLSGTQIDGIHRLETGKMNLTYGSNKESVTDYGRLIVDFGRHLYDTELAFDPTRFKNPQIRVTHDRTTPEANATALTLAIYAFIMEDIPVRPGAFLMMKEHKSWAATSTEWEYTDMPRDYIYRKLFLQALTKIYGIEAHYSRVRLSEDNEKRIPFDTLTPDQVAQNALDYGPTIEHVSGQAYTSGHPFFAAPAYSPSIAVMNDAGTNAFQVVIFDGGQFEVRSANGTDTFRGFVEGLAPQGLVAWHMGMPMEIDTWYNPRDLGNLRLEVLGAGSYTVRLITQQKRTY